MEAEIMAMPMLLKSAQVADMLLVAESQLSRWRSNGRGPDWVDVEGSPRYVLADVLFYIERQTRRGKAA